MGKITVKELPVSGFKPIEITIRVDNEAELASLWMSFNVSCSNLLSGNSHRPEVVAIHEAGDPGALGRFRQQLWTVVNHHLHPFMDAARNGES